MNHESVDTFSEKKFKKTLQQIYKTDLVRENKIIFPCRVKKTTQKENWKHAFYRF